MKELFTFILILIVIGAPKAQQASDFFPQQTGFEWKFKSIPLDSVSNPINSASYFRIDSFESVANFNGRSANIVKTKSGPLQTIQVLPFTDSLYYSTSGTDGYEYFSIRNIESFLRQLDSTGVSSNFSFLDFFTSLQNWYPVYRFASAVNTEYTLLQKDTVINISSTNYNLRFKYVGRRYQDETIPTVLGNLSTKKFLLQWKVAYLLGPISIDLFSTKDTIWIAQNNWIVQDIIPGQYINNLTFLGVPAFSIPGLETKLTDEIFVSVKNENINPVTFSLEQNCPNPFNPSTKISWQSPVAGQQTIKVYDVLGNDIAILVDEYKPAGSYEVDFNASSLPSGVYFYQLSSGEFIQTRKMILIK